MDDLYCVPKVLPEDQWLDAAIAAIDINPSNRPPVEEIRNLLGQVVTATMMGRAPVGHGAEVPSDIVLEPGHLAVMTGKYWGAKGVDLGVSFLEPTSTELRDRILSHMNAWGDFSNVKFRWSQSGGQVRITRNGDGYWSYLGTDILRIKAGEPTMCLQGFSLSTSEAEYRRVVRHETGHSLGCPHEHMRKAIVARLDRAKTIAWGRQQLGWSEGMVISQILTAIDEAALQATATADQDSLLCYQLPASITIDGQPIRGGTDFSASDKKLAAQLYPKEVQPPPPPKPEPPKPGDGGILSELLNKLVAWLMDKFGPVLLEMILKWLEEWFKKMAADPKKAATDTAEWLAAIRAVAASPTVK